MKRAALVTIVMAIAAGCGYQLAGRNTFLPERIRIIAVAPFENRTNRPEIEQRVTEAVARELSKRGRYRVVASAESADAVMEGAIVGFRTQPVRFNVQGRATRLETVVTLQATLRDQSTGEILWNQTSLLFRDQYDVPETEVDYFERETLSLEEIARGAAETLVNSIFEGF